MMLVLRCTRITLCGTIGPTSPGKPPGTSPHCKRSPSTVSSERLRLMLATERLLEIEQRFDTAITRIVPLELDGQTLRLSLYLKDGTNLRLTEQWNGDQLERYSY